MAIVRVRADVQSVVSDPESKVFVALRPDDPYDSSHPLVREYPWAFTRDNSPAEQATAAPGERRNR